MSVIKEYLQSLGLEEVDFDVHSNGIEKWWYGYVDNTRYEIDYSDAYYHQSNNSNWDKFVKDCDIIKESCCGDDVDETIYFCPTCGEHI